MDDGSTEQYSSWGKMFIGSKSVENLTITFIIII